MLFRHVLPAALMLAGLAAPALAQDPSFRLNNRTGVVITEVYVESSARADWGDDLLGANVLQPGQSLTIRLPNGQCMNDVRVVYANGRSQDWRQRNTCELTDFTIN